MPVNIDLLKFSEILRNVSVAGMLLTAILGGYKGFYVWRWSFDAMAKNYDDRLAALSKERDEWKAIALHGIGLAEQALVKTS